MFRPFLRVGFPYFSLPFGVTNRRFHSYRLHPTGWHLTGSRARKWHEKGGEIDKMEWKMIHDLKRNFWEGKKTVWQIEIPTEKISKRKRAKVDRPQLQITLTYHHSPKSKFPSQTIRTFKAKRRQESCNLCWCASLLGNCKSLVKPQRESQSEIQTRRHIRWTSVRFFIREMRS